MHWILVLLGIGAAIFALAQLKIRRVGSALVFGLYAITFFAIPWPRVLTVLACVAVIDGFRGLYAIITKTGRYAVLELTEKGKKHFLFVEIGGIAIRGILLGLAWFFIGF